MKTSLRLESLRAIDERLANEANLSGSHVLDASDRQPIHTVYGGAQLFRPDTPTKLGKLALRSLDSYASDPEDLTRVFGISEDIAATIHERITRKLTTEPVEDLRIDFEDGYGLRSDAEEDGHAHEAARNAAEALSQGQLPKFFGIRIKPLSAEMQARSLRTLDIFLTTFASGTDDLPEEFVVTLPKVVSPVHVEVLAHALGELEVSLGHTPGSVRMEIMIETSRSIIDETGRIMMPRLIDAAGGRLRGAHFGAYDYTASCGIAAGYQDMLHTACDFARNMMLASFSGTGIWLSDGATNIMPVGPHRGDELDEKQIDENRSVVHRAWKLHFDHCRNSLQTGFYQGWDLHPAQLPSRYAAVYSFFMEGLELSAKRLKNFLDNATKASMVGNLFDDAATGQGLLNYFLRAIKCGAITEAEAHDHTGLTMEELRSASFTKIMSSRL